jgi:inositol-1,3,4-trisphosphate 5/6-kinase/inositol-tetrakisphosphate 1-kinase
MSLIFNDAGLKDIEVPCVAQSFINHNAVMYKIFVIGSQHYIVERPSIKNLYASGMTLAYQQLLVY